MNLPASVQSRNLFVLIGANPLPNYVAIKLLKPEEGHVFLVYTTQTAPVAKRLCKAAGLVPRRNATYIHVDEMQARDIAHKVGEHLHGLSDIALHYSGGTKQMVLYSYQSIIDHLAGTGCRPVLSYLDARSLELRVNDGTGSEIAWKVDLAVRPSIRELLELHGYTTNAYQTMPLAPEIYADLVRVPYNALKSWRSRAFSGNRGNLEQIPLPSDPQFSRLQAHFGNARTLGELAAMWGCTANQIGPWLQGLWLEHYALSALQGVAEEVSIHDTGMHFKTLERNFEFDVLAMRGYQLYALSCTLESSSKAVKHKLFEAYIRARQMGGDEARVAVVSRVPTELDKSPATIQHEVEEKWDAEGKIRVFGQQHLADLPGHLHDWLQTGHL